MGTLPYWLLFATVSAFSVSEMARNLRPLRRGLGAFTAVALVLFVGLRYGSVDYSGYQAIWERVSFQYFSVPFFTSPGGTTGNEFLFASVLSAYKYVSLPFEVLLFSVALASLGIKFHFFSRYSPYFLICVVLYLSMGLLKDLGQIRNALAAAILLFSIEPILNRQPFRFLLIVSAAFGVQAFAIVAFPLYWLYPILRNKLLLTILLISAFAISTMGGAISGVLYALDFIPDQMFGKALGYYYSEMNVPLYYHPLNVSFFFFALVFVWLSSALTRNLSVAPVLILFHAYSVAIYFLSFNFSIVAGRVFELLSFNSVIILLTQLALLLPKELRALFMVGLILYSGLLFSSTINSYSGVASYQNILFH